MPKLTPLRCAGLLLLLSTIALHAQTVTSFEGMDASQLAKPQYDIDPNGAIGTKQFMEWTNSYYQAWNKTTFATVWSKAQAGSTPFTTNGNTNCASVAGDGLVIFDRLASRWVIGVHNAGSTNYYYCIAISNTDDLSSASLAWFTYAIPLNNVLGTNGSGNTYFPDWPKLATWGDAYYFATDMQDPNNKFAEVGVLVCAFDRANMLVGGTANTPICFTQPSTITGSVFLAHSFEPADVEGTTPPPAGAPEYYASIQNPPLDGVTTTSDSLNLWQFHVDWSNPANSTFMQTSVPVATYQPGCYIPTIPTNTVCVPEPSTSSTNNFIDSIGDRFMFRFDYRNFGTYQSYLATHTIQVGTGNGSQTGIRWYELRGNGVPTVFQSGTVDPDNALYRFMPSIAQDQSGNAAVGYSTSSSSVHPAIKASYWSLTGQTSPTEINLFSGAADEENTYHWGDYTSMTVDPVNGCTFWYVNEYFNTNQIGTGKPVWQTRISNFTLPTCGSVTLTPTSLGFGQQAVGTTSASQQLILNNGQSTALTINNIFGSGNNPGDFQQSNDCGSSVPAGASCTINIAFAPTATGARSATINVSDSAANSPQTATVTGTGINGGTIGLSTTSVNFGNQAGGTTSAPVQVTVTNTGNATVTFTSIQVTGTNGTNFGETDNCSGNLASGNSCTINLNFTPGQVGSYSATVVLTDSATNSPQNISLAGTGIVPVVLSMTTLNFGPVLVGSFKNSPAVTLTNKMNVQLTGVTIAISGTGYTQVNTCSSTIAAGGTCTITVTFTPTAAGTSTGTVTITDSANTSPQTIALSGTGQLPVGVNPLTLAFGSVTVGTTTAAKTITVTNNLKTALTITGITITGTDAADYAETNNCGTSLAAAAKCTISVTFTPKAKGGRPATLNITDSATTSPQIVHLNGTGM
ncbi:MAG TPA: choice-of-anchor D domain-containing protein [Candidatus Solibacter sp.]|nr:choice-of-anchor D domain-containing protein [Candidatus Solibacter sp.]